MRKIKEHSFQISLLFSLVVAVLGWVNYTGSSSEKELVHIPLLITYLMLGFDVFCAVVFSINQLLSKSDKSKALNVLFPVLGVIIVFFVAYFISDTSEHRLVNGLVITVYVLLGFGFFSLVFLEIKNAIKS